MKPISLARRAFNLHELLDIPKSVMKLGARLGYSAALTLEQDFSDILSRPTICPEARIREGVRRRLGRERVILLGIHRSAVPGWTASSNASEG